MTKHSFSVGDCVKIQRSNERIWILVNKIVKNAIYGTVDSYPLNPEGKKYGEQIMFNTADIIEIFNDKAA